MTGLPTTDGMFDLRMSEGAKPLYEQVKAFIADEVEPVTAKFFALGEGREDRWTWAPGQLVLAPPTLRHTLCNSGVSEGRSRSSWRMQPSASKWVVW